MNNTINGRTPDEIKKALRICSGKLLDYCDACIYCNWSSDCACNSRMCADALDYIQELENHIGELTEKVSQLEAAQPKWISVEERLPGYKEGMRFIVSRNDGTVCEGRFEVSNGRWYELTTDGLWEIEVTHWMPLPSTEGIE